MALGKYLLLACCVGLACAQISVNYRVEYNEVGGQCGGTDLPNVTLSVPVYSTVQSVMEAAVSQDSAYQFQLRYSNAYSGYVVTMLGSTSNQDPCRWTLYVRVPGSSEVRANSAVDAYNVANGYTVILRYEMMPATYNTQYSIEYPDSACANSTSLPAISVVAPTGSSALQIMERAARLNGRRYLFTTTYVSSSSSYDVVEIDGNKRTSVCFWVAFTTSGDDDMRLTESISEFVIPSDNFQLILRFTEQTLPTTASPIMATTGGDLGISSCFIAVLLLNLLALLFIVV